MKLAQTLKFLAKNKKITIRELSRAVDVSESTIKTWLGGSNPRNLQDVRTCARFFNVSLEFLLFGEEECQPRTLDEIELENVFEGWIKVSVQRPTRNRVDKA